MGSVVTMRLSESAQTVLDTNGYGVARLTCPPAQRWRVTSVSIQVNPVPGGSGFVPSATLYRGDPSPVGRLDGTDAGANNTSDVAFTLVQGESVSIEWQSGDPGAVAFFTLTGERDTRHALS